MTGESRNDIEKTAKANFTNQRLLELIKLELDKDHIGNDIEKVLVFAIAISGFLPQRYRCSCVLNGDSSEGKTNIMKAVKNHLPIEKYRWYDGMTKSGVQGDLKNSPFVGTLFFKELNTKDENYAMFELLKSICEEDHSKTKRNIETNNKELITYNIPKLTGIYATTKLINDDELSNRFIVISILGNPRLYESVNEYTKESYKDVEKAIEQDERQNEETWIKYGLGKLLKPVDYFIIPTIDCISPNNQIARSKCDLKRFLNIACSLAWLYQLQRPLHIVKGKVVVEVLAEDLMNAHAIMLKSLSQSFNSLSGRDLDTIKAIHKNAKLQFFAGAEENVKYIERRELQSALNIKTSSGVWKRLSSLKANNAITVIMQKDKNLSWISLNYDIIETLKGSFLTGDTLSCLKAYITKSDTICFDNTSDVDETETEIEPETQPQQRLDVQLSQKDRIDSIRGCIELNKNDVTQEKLEAEGFEPSFIATCIEKGLIFKKPNGNYGVN